MKNYKKGSTPIIVIIILVIVIIGIGRLTYFKGVGGWFESKSIIPSTSKNDAKSSETNKTEYYDSLPYAAIRTNVGTMSVWASTFFDRYNTYTGICNAKNEKVKAIGMDKFLESTLKIVSSADIYCNSSEKAFVYSLHMPDGNSWCADSVYQIGHVISTKVKTLSCK